VAARAARATRLERHVDQGRPALNATSIKVARR